MNNRHLITLLLLPCIYFLGFSCSKEDVKQQYFEDHKETDALISSQSETSGEVKTITYLGQEFEAEKFGDHYMIDGDIAVTEDEINNELKIAARTKGKWPGNIVYFHIEPSALNPNIIKEAIAYMTARTNITFIEKTAVSHEFSKAYISFETGNGCWSSIGRLGRKQTISLKERCYTLGTIVHEICHALGVWHEQNRKDRDKYITINWDNIKEGKERNFKMYSKNSAEYSSFDFNSIMMYSPKSFSVNGKPTITKKDGSLYAVNRSGLSTKDRQGLNKIYRNIYQKVSLLTNNKKFLRTYDEEDPLGVDGQRDHIWELFSIVKFAGDKVAFKGNNNKYLSVSTTKEGVVSFTASHIGSNEIFEIERQNRNKIAIKATINNKYLSSNNDHKSAACNRTIIGPWELFTIKSLN